jgi:hypothetical protein
MNKWLAFCGLERINDEAVCTEFLQKIRPECGLPNESPNEWPRS